MMTEKYRETVARLNERFGGKELLPVDAVAEMFGVDKRTLVNGRTLPIRKLMSRYYISVADIADFLTRDITKSCYRWQR